MVSLALHATVGWWALQSDRQNRRILPPVTPEQRLQVLLLTRVEPSSTPTATPTPPRSERQTKRSAPTTPSRAPPHPLTDRPTLADERVLPPQPTFAEPSKSSATLSAQALPATGRSQAGQPTLDLNLSHAAQTADRLRRQSPLAAAVDTQQVQAAPSSVARAFSGFKAAASGIESETTLAGGARLVRFSGGGCMRIPNPSAKEHDDTHKPVVQSC